MFKALIFSIVLMFVNNLWAWGERGHHIIGSIAAQIEAKYTKPKEKSYGYAQFMKQRALMMGLYSNVPDTVWKDAAHRHKLDVKTNFATHFLDIEYFLGPPTKNLKSYLKKYDQIPLPYSKVKEMYEGKPSPFAQKGNNTIHIFKNVGTNPWRTRDLYDYAVEALTCFHNKSKTPGFKFDKYPNVDSQIVNSPGKPTKSYICQKDVEAQSDLFTALQFMGILSHFVGDLAQPYHNSLDYDGWYTGNQGLHGFFESHVVNELGEGLSNKVYKLATKKWFQNELWKELNPGQSLHKIEKLMLNLSKNAYSDLGKIRKLDNKYAILKKSTQLDWGVAPHLLSKDKKKKATRKKVSTRMKRAFEKLIIKRMAVGSYVLSRIWKMIWIDSGRPNLNKALKIDALPYIKEVPFIWPQYDKLDL